MFSERKPNEERPLDPEDMDNPYVRKPNESRPQKDARLKVIREKLRGEVTKAVGVKDKKYLRAFNNGWKGGR